MKPPVLAVLSLPFRQGLDAFPQSGLYSNHQDIGPRYSSIESKVFGQQEADSGGSREPDATVVNTDNLKLVHSELGGTVVCGDADVVDATADIASAVLSFKQEQRCHAGSGTFVHKPFDLEDKEFCPRSLGRREIGRPTLGVPRKGGGPALILQLLLGRSPLLRGRSVL
ncbi:hypothetical protein Nepgr_016205 [Nepenthes gracilis]|uniref:Uncharacterized protein n=1 Tax=Nepenthes gracilis TaxID=150966 RepID=A0AAD3SPD2_NEPGR|nr:hypothetical protein Nepgr_016205 [Nepenthes gracilis]